MSKGGSRFGAGRKSHNQKAELTLALDIRVLNRGGYLRRRYPFAWAWITNYGEQVASATLLIKDESICISYIWFGHHLEIVVKLETTPCNFGSSRVWLKCPKCDGRCAKIFLNNRDGYYACRKCVGVSYYSQSEDQMDRVWRKQNKLENKLCKNLTKPKGMHHSTHKRILSRIRKYAMLREDMLFTYSQRLALL